MFGSGLLHFGGGRETCRGTLMTLNFGVTILQNSCDEWRLFEGRGGEGSTKLPAEDVSVFDMEVALDDGVATCQEY